MYNKSNNSNAKEALKQMKMEIANELGLPHNSLDGAYKSAYENGFLGGRVGGLMSKKLVEMGERQLIEEYNNKNNL